MKVLNISAPASRVASASARPASISGPASRFSGARVSRGAMRTVCMSDKTQTDAKLAAQAEVDALLKQTEAMLGKSGTDSDSSGDTSVPDGLELQCDESGCAFVPTSAVKSGADASLKCDTNGCFLSEDGVAASSSSFKLLSGEGWRYGFETDPSVDDKYVALVGSANWSVALSSEEFNDFYTLLQTLRQSVSAMDSAGEWESGEDGIATLEVKTDRVWMQGSAPAERLNRLQKLWSNSGAEGAESAFDLRFVITTQGQRETEGYLTAKAVLSMLEVMEEEGAGSLKAMAV
eukprot:CAMPEP_0182913600 /NCGR_PEP_ID=MMETSP0034_2-20130328/38125_1 /TAXON_ID=156128 /ORGANISM="Nephroselmis pyriformis, Strain CCMP717" /LENGTH=290 /DNA_ID=CAMNT_0025050327 /DNA_START=36 /DNA_END=908 /DNA_ORIENTATION=-